MSKLIISELPPTRKEALVIRSRHFFTGKLCRNGHLAPRFVSDKSCMECRRNSTKKWFDDHRAHKRSYDRKYLKEKRKQRTQYMTRWAKKNPEKSSIWRKNAYALRKAKKARGKLDGKTIALLMKSQNQKCAYCRKCIRKRYHLDHIVALSRGGNHDLPNWQLLCPKCNTAKGNKDSMMFARQLGLLL